MIYITDWLHKHLSILDWPKNLLKHMAERKDPGGAERKDPGGVERRDPWEGYGFEADWWSLGVTAYEMLVGKPPFGYGEADDLESQALSILSKIKNKIKFPDRISKDAKNFIKLLLHSDKNQRLGSKGSSDIFEHAWFKNIKWSELLTSEAPLFNSNLNYIIPKITKNDIFDNF
eukprot:GHVL01018929.1.p1 GENE.GHVL01018929.1~~GHVL01018929.1.p1  ORF type:complete len:174 (+),score=46.88 GHVL01018929.1:381-902(+)